MSKLIELNYINTKILHWTIIILLSMLHRQFVCFISVPIKLNLQSLTVDLNMFDKLKVFLSF